MKLKLLITAALLAMGWTSSAQTERHHFLIGGYVSFSTTNENTNAVQINSLAIGPRVGYFLGNNLAVGMEFNYNLSKLDGAWYDYFDTERGYYVRGFGFREENFGLSPFIRQYIPVNNSFRAFAQGNLTFQLNTYKNIDDMGYLYRTDVYFKGFGASLNLGLVYFPSPKWGIELSFPFVRYFNERTSRSNYPAGNKKDFNTVADNFIPSIGVNFHLN